MTTDETSLADWLRQNGHRVVPSPVEPEEFAQALLDAMAHPLEPAAVRSSIPAIAGRIAADRWLNAAEREVRSSASGARI